MRTAWGDKKLDAHCCLYVGVQLLIPASRVTGQHHRADVLRLFEPVCEMRPNRRPLAIEDAVHAGVAQGAVAREHMLPQYAVQFRAQSFKGGGALPIEGGGAEPHCNAI